MQKYNFFFEKHRNLSFFHYFCSMNINEKTWAFIRQHQDDDVRKVALLGVKDQETDIKQALQQIAGRQTARKKLPSWAAVDDIVYPPHLNMEQCSSELTARYKADWVMGDRCLVMGDSTRFVDLTGGFGVDFYWMAQAISQHPSPTTYHLNYVEMNEELCAIARHNFALLGLECSVCCCDTTTYLTEMPHADLVFLDPARRNEHGGRTYGIADCTPNVLELLPTLLSKADRVLLKLSPMLDWRKAVEDLQHPSPITHHPSPHVSSVHIVSVNNECKELLIEVRNDFAGNLRLVCVNLLPNGERQVFSIGGQSPCTTHTGDSPQPSISHLSFLTSHFLYEPNASIMKAGCFAELEQCFPVRQIAPNSHLFLTTDIIDNFPGRGFQILAISSMNKQEMKRQFAEIINQKLTTMESANITVRNFPMSAEQLRKKLKLKDGGDTYIFATTLADGEHKLLICRKIG